MRNVMIGRVGLLFVLLAAPLALAGDDPSEAELVEMGRRLFFEPAVSRSGRFACAACHAPEHGFSDPRTVSVEHDGPMRRHSQPLTDLVDGSGMHWDGEFATVRDLIEARLVPGRVSTFSVHRNRRRIFEEARKAGGKPDADAFAEARKSLPTPRIKGNLQFPPKQSAFAPINERLALLGYYASAFDETFGREKPTMKQIADAVEAYVHSLKTNENAVDRYLNGDPDALTEQQRRGHALFLGKANCAACHTLKLENGRAAMTDRSYRNTGVAYPGLLVVKNKQRGGDGGRGELTHVEGDLGRFKVPSLRDVALRAPYMHDGTRKSLADVIDYYARGGRGPDVDPELRRIRITDAEKEDLLGFLHALTSTQRAGVGPARRSQRTRLTIVGVDGRPLKGFAVTVRGFGDRLQGGSRAATLKLTTDKRGVIEFAFPAWTHVCLEADRHEIARGMPIPDSVRKLELRAAPTDAICVEILTAPSVPKRIEALGEGGRVAVLTRVRKLGGQRALYAVTDVPRNMRGKRVRVHLSNDTREGGIVELDLRRGEAEAIHLPTVARSEQGYG